MSLDGLQTRADLKRFVESVLSNPSLTGVQLAEAQAHLTNLQVEVDALIAGTVVDATTTVKGKLKLAGDLAGTADLPIVPGLAAKQDAATAATDAELTAGLATKANTVHTHAQADVTSLVSDLALKAPLASPPLTGNPTAPTQTAGNNSTRLATTAFVKSQKVTDLTLPTTSVPMNSQKHTGLVQGSVAGDSVEYAQMIAGDVAAQLGLTSKAAVAAATIAALPANARTGDTLNANVNGFLSPSFGSLEFDFKSGSSGTGNGQFNQSYDVALDSSGNIFVLDRDNNRVQKFTSAGVVVTTGGFPFGTVGTGNGQFTKAAGIAIDSTDRIYVIDRTRVQRFTTAGVHSTTLITLPDVTAFTTSGGLGIHIDSSGNVYVAWESKVFAFSVNDHRVAKYNSVGVQQFVAGVGSGRGSGNGEFHTPTAIAVDGSSNIFVCDGANHRVQKFNSAGTYQSKFGTYGSGDGQFLVPTGIDFDTAGDIWVADYFNARIQKFTSGGVYSAQIGSGGSGNGQLVGPRGIDIDGSNNIFVADSLNHRFQKFAPFAFPATPFDVLVNREGGDLDTAAINNGIYTVTAIGSGASKWAMTRRADATGTNLKNNSLVIAQLEGVTESRAFILTTDNPITANTTPQEWTRFEPGGPPSPHSVNHQPGSTDALATEAATTLTGTNSEGSSTSFARADHNHAIQAVESFEAYRNAAFNLAGGTNAKLPFDAETFDVSGRFDISNGRYTPQKAGYYRVSAYLTLNANIAAGNFVYLQVWKNGGGSRELAWTPYNALFNPRLGGTAVIYMNGTTDYLEIYYGNSDGTARAVATSAQFTRFDGHFIGTA